MLTERERLHGLNRQVDTLRKGYDWRAADAVTEERDELQEKLAYYDDLVSEMLSMADDKVQAGQLWAAISKDNYQDIQGRASKLASALFAEGYMTPAEFKSLQARLVFVPSVTRRAREIQAEEQNWLDQAFQTVLETVNRADRQQALNVYNSKCSGPRDREKLEEWVKKLVAAELLPKHYLVGARYGNALEKLLNPDAHNKMVAGGKENK